MLMCILQKESDDQNLTRLKHRNLTKTKFLWGLIRGKQQDASGVQ